MLVDKQDKICIRAQLQLRRKAIINLGFSPC